MEGLNRDLWDLWDFQDKKPDFRLNAGLWRMGRITRSVIQLSLAACLSHAHCGLVAGAGVEGEICE